MLIRFEVANFRSILNPVELSMVAVDRDRPEARPVENLGESLLPVAAIYGANASGKSNVLAALGWLRNAVEDSLRFWDDEIPMEPFAFAGGSDRVSEFTVEMVIAGVRFEYALELDRQAVRYEALFHYPARRRRMLFEREGEQLRLQRGLGSIGGTRELLTTRTLALSIARRFDEPLVSGFAHDLLATQIMGVRLASARRGSPTDRSMSTLGWFDESALEREADVSPDRAQALAMLKLADLGIDDVVVERQEVVASSVDAEVGRKVTIRRTRLLHRTAGDSLPLDLAAESHGTRTWYGLIGPVLSALRSGSLVLYDELDAGLHPHLTAELIRLFHDPATNPHGAQLIFTSHDTSLLRHLNRDEVWLTEKDERGVTRLGALAEFAGETVRRSKNLEREYLHGRFGAVPDVDRVEMLRALGLVG